MSLTLLVALVAAFYALAVFATALAVLWYDILAPALERRHTRIRSTGAATFVDDPFPACRYEDPLHVLGGSGAGSTTAFFEEDEDA